MKTARELDDANERLERAGKLAHEFNNVLAVIVASASSISEEGTEMSRADAEAIIAAAERAAWLVNELAITSQGWVPERVSTMTARSPVHKSGKSEGDAVGPATDRRPLVIVIDDEITVARSVARLLGRCGFETIVCTKAADALRAIEAAPVGETILLSDVMMPDVDGLELAASARRLVPELPILLMSGGGVDVTASGFELIAKPFDAKTIKARLLALINQRL